MSIQSDHSPLVVLPVTDTNFRRFDSAPRRSQNLLTQEQEYDFAWNRADASPRAATFRRGKVGNCQREIGLRFGLDGLEVIVVAFVCLPS